MNTEEIKKCAHKNRRLLFQTQAVLKLIDRSFENGNVQEMSDAAGAASHILEGVIDSLEELEYVELTDPVAVEVQS